MGYALELMKMGKNDEWYTPRHAVEIILPYVPDNATVWCPFDTQSSQYVHVFNGGGVKRLLQAILQMGKTFFVGNRRRLTTVLSATRHTAGRMKYLQGFFN